MPTPSSAAATRANRGKARAEAIPVSSSSDDDVRVVSVTTRNRGGASRGGGGAGPSSAAAAATAAAGNNDQRNKRRRTNGGAAVASGRGRGGGGAGPSSADTPLDAGASGTTPSTVIPDDEEDGGGSAPDSVVVVGGSSPPNPRASASRRRRRTSTVAMAAALPPARGSAPARSGGSNVDEGNVSRSPTLLRQAQLDADAALARRLQQAEDARARTDEASRRLREAEASGTEDAAAANLSRSLFEDVLRASMRSIMAAGGGGASGSGSGSGGRGAGGPQLPTSSLSPSSSAPAAARRIAYLRNAMSNLEPMVDMLAEILSGRDGSPSASAAAAAAVLRGLPAQLDALRAMSGASAGGSGLPASLLFSDRDFTEEDYDALLALDEGVRARDVAPRSAIDALPRSKVPEATSTEAADGRGGDRERCSICLQDYEAGETVMKLPCSHVYHATCVERWLGECRGSCPVCTQKVTAASVASAAAAARARAAAATAASGSAAAAAKTSSTPSAAAGGSSRAGRGGGGVRGGNRGGSE